MHHQGVGDTLDDWALGLLETTLGPTASGVREEDSVLWLHGDVVLRVSSAGLGRGRDSGDG